MKAYRTLVFIVMLVVLACISISADTAADHYIAGDKSYKAGNLDSAINEWVLALQIKPDSVQTLKMLVKAQDEKITELKRKLGEMALNTIAQESVQPQTQVVYVDSRQLDPIKYNFVAVRNLVMSPTLTTAQVQENWSFLQGKKVTWTGVVSDVFVMGGSKSQVWFTCDGGSVCADVFGKHDNLWKGTKIKVNGDLDAFNYKLKKGQTFSFHLTNCNIN